MIFLIWLSLSSDMEEVIEVNELEPCRYEKPKLHSDISSERNRKPRSNACFNLRPSRWHAFARRKRTAKDRQTKEPSNREPADTARSKSAGFWRQARRP